jgi:hypothetical protein
MGKRHQLLNLIHLQPDASSCKSGAGHLSAHEKIAGYSPDTQDTIMEAERVNLIGNTLADLSARTQELRGYL